MAKRVVSGLRKTQQKRVLGVGTFVAISAVEGLHLDQSGKKRLAAMALSGLSSEEQRGQVVAAYKERAAQDRQCQSEVYENRERFSYTPSAMP